RRANARAEPGIENATCQTGCKSAWPGRRTCGPSGGIDFRVPAADALQLLARGAAGGELGLLHQHVGDIVLYLESWAAAAADQPLPLAAERGLAHRADEEGEQFLTYHATNSLRQQPGSSPAFHSGQGPGRMPVERWSGIIVRRRPPVKPN